MFNHRNRPSAARNPEKRLAVSVDRRSIDRIEWAAHALRLKIKAQVAPSVLLRRALEHYVRHLDRLLEAEDDGKYLAEAVALRRAASGNSEALPQEHLLDTPPRPFGTIEQAVRGAAKKRRVGWTPMTDEECHAGE